MSWLIKSADATAQVVGNYELGATIGQGAFGTVKVATHAITGEKLAIKIIPDAATTDIKLEQEIANQKLLDHQHVVRIREVLQEQDVTYIVMDLVAGGDLFDYIVRHVRVPEKIARRIFQQLVAGVEHCHDCKIAHRDLKPENIFMDQNGNIKIGDFGLSVVMLEGHRLTESCGSPNYAAPELLMKDCAYEGVEVDVWACGVILYAILAGSLPFDAPSVPELFRLIRKGKFSLPGFISDGAKDLIRQMLVLEPASRITIAHVREHAWFKVDLAPEIARTSPIQMYMEPLQKPVAPEKLSCAILGVQDQLESTWEPLKEVDPVNEPSVILDEQDLLETTWESVVTSPCLNRATTADGPQHPLAVSASFDGAERCSSRCTNKLTSWLSLRRLRTTNQQSIARNARSSLPGGRY